MLRLGEFLLFHEDADQLRQRGDLLVLDADDRQQLEDHEKQEDRNADEGKGVVLDAKLFGHPPHAIGPERQADEWETDQKEQERVAFLKSVRAEPADGQQQQQQAERRQDHAPGVQQVHIRSPFPATGRGPGRARDKRSL